MIPFTVTIRLCSPIAVADAMPLRLDGLLMGALGCAMGSAHPDGWVDPAEVYAAPLPLARVEAGGTWWYAASALPLSGPEVLHHRNRRPPVDEAERLTRVKSLNVAAGCDKALRVPYWTRPEMMTLRFTGVGDIAEVARILAHLTSVGKHGNAGHGWIRWHDGIEVTEGGPALDAYRSPEVRPVPVASLARAPAGRHAIRSQPVRPPYWSKVGAVPCWVRV